MRWLAAQAEERGIEVYPGFAAAKLLFEGERVVGVQIQDRGVARDGRPKTVFEPGPEIRARCVVLGEGNVLVDDGDPGWHLEIQDGIEEVLF